MGSALALMQNLAKVPTPRDSSPDRALSARNIELVRRFQREHGHLDVERSKDERLRQWSKEIRSRCARRQLESTIELPLRLIGFPFSKDDCDWERGFAALIEQRSPARAWGAQQRRLAVLNRLPPARALRLAAAGFFESSDAPALARKPGNSSRAKRKTRLSRRGAVQVESSDFGRDFETRFATKSREPMELDDDAMLAQLEARVRQVGHFLVDGTGDHRQLHAWLNAVREQIADGTLSPEVAKRLRAMNFSFEKPDPSWERVFARLFQYRQTFRRFPRGSNPLAKWLERQRALTRYGELASSRVARLKALGALD